MMAVGLLVHLAVVKTTLPDQSRSAQLESGVRRKAPAPFGRGERLQSPTYPYVRPLTAQEITSEKLRLDNSVRATQPA